MSLYMRKVSLRLIRVSFWYRFVIFLRRVLLSKAAEGLSEKTEDIIRNKMKLALETEYQSKSV